MKSKSFLYIFYFLSLLISSNVLFAQKTSSYDFIMNELTPAQKTLLQKEREVIKTNREALKATLTKEQLSILKNKTIPRAEVRSKLLATFSETQKGLIKNQEIRLRKSRESFRKSLTKDQRKLLKEGIDKIKNAKDRGELKDRVKERNKEGGSKTRNPRGN